jgi:hypothetical protein
MTIYYVKQDNTIWGCGDPECCGEWYEEIDETFVECKCEQIEFDMAEHLQVCKGGGPILKWRKATPKEIQAFSDGKDDGYSDGHWAGIEYQKKEDARKAEFADKRKTEQQRTIHELVHLGYKITVDGSKIGKSINHYTEYSEDTILETPAMPSEFVNNFGISIKTIENKQTSIYGMSFTPLMQVYSLDVGDESVEITANMAFNIAKAMDEYKKKFGGK